MRKKLKKLDGQRIQVTAVVVAFSKRPHCGIKVPVTLLANVKRGDELLCDHVWVEGWYPPGWQGQVMEFSAKVLPYRRRNHELDYGLCHIGEERLTNGESLEERYKSPLRNEVTPYERAHNHPAPYRQRAESKKKLRRDSRWRAHSPRNRYEYYRLR